MSQTAIPSLGQKFPSMCDSGALSSETEILLTHHVLVHFGRQWLAKRTPNSVGTGIELLSLLLRGASETVVPAWTRLAC